MRGDARGALRSFCLYLMPSGDLGLRRVGKRMRRRWRYVRIRCAHTLLPAATYRRCRWRSRFIGVRIGIASRRARTDGGSGASKGHLRTESDKIYNRSTSSAFCSICLQKREIRKLKDPNCSYIDRVAVGDGVR